MTELPDLDARAVPRRIVLLDAARKVERLLATPKASAVKGTLRHMALMYPGQTVAAEWFGALGWVRWLEARK